MMPPLHMAETHKDALGKVKGLYSVGVYFMMANYIMMKSLFKNIIHIINFNFISYCWYNYWIIVYSFCWTSTCCTTNCISYSNYGSMYNDNY